MQTRYFLVTALLLCLLSPLLAGAVCGHVHGTSAMLAQAGPDSGSVEAGSAAPLPQPGAYYEWAVVIPPLVAILLAIFTRQVVPALVVAVLVGSGMMLRVAGSENLFAHQPGVIRCVRVAVEHYLFTALLDADHMKIIVFTLVIGFMVGVMGRNGGTAGMVNLMAGKATSKWRGALTAWLAGLVVFFDDYANTMVVGPTMRPVFDRLRLSRAKLAYIVDSTAAPVASIAIIGTWVGAEIGYIQQGIDTVVQSGSSKAADLLANTNGMSAFIQSLGYRFYPILALILVFWIAITGRDFGPMLASERRAAAGHTPASPSSSAQERSDGGQAQARPRSWLAIIPLLVLVGATLSVLGITGWRASQPAQTDTKTSTAVAEAASAVPQSGTEMTDAPADEDKTAAEDSIKSAAEPVPLWRRASTILGNADSYISILYGALLAAAVAVLATMLARACNLHQAFDAGLNGMAQMFPAVVILVLAWSLAHVTQDLQLGQNVKGWLSAASFPLTYLPTAVFVSAAGVSFATGTSWGTMGILCPMVVQIAARLAADLPEDQTAQAMPLFYASIGAVLAGSIFGDHCSPISDTTVLSSIAAGCPHEEHVWTQIPYALLTTIVGIATGDVLCNVFDQPWYLGLMLGSLVLMVFVLLIGRTSPRQEADPPQNGEHPFRPTPNTEPRDPNAPYDPNQPRPVPDFPKVWIRPPVADPRKK